MSVPTLLFGMAVPVAWEYSWAALGRNHPPVAVPPPPLPTSRSARLLSTGGGHAHGGGGGGGGFLLLKCGEPRRGLVRHLGAHLGARSLACAVPLARLAAHLGLRRRRRIRRRRGSGRPLDGSALSWRGVLYTVYFILYTLYFILSWRRSRCGRRSG